jgi:hypothetical protein
VSYWFTSRTDTYFAHKSQGESRHASTGLLLSFLPLAATRRQLRSMVVVRPKEFCTEGLEPWLRKLPRSSVHANNREAGNVNDCGPIFEELPQPVLDQVAKYLAWDPLVSSSPAKLLSQIELKERLGWLSGHRSELEGQHLLGRNSCLQLCPPVPPELSRYRS